MPRQLIKRYLPDPAKMKAHKSLRHMGDWLHDENLWHLNRRSVSGGVAAGLFWALIPIPAQMVAAALTAIWLRINFPISVVLVWITNPFTMPPIFYFNYLVGTWLLGKPDRVGEFHLSVEWMGNELANIWKPLYLGSLIVAAVAACLGYSLMRAYWRWYVIKRFQARPGNVISKFRRRSKRPGQLPPG